MFGKTQSAGGSFFKPAKEDPNNVYVVEALRYEADVPSQFGPRNLGWANLTVFKDGKGKPEVRENAQFENAALSSAIRGAIGGAPLLVKIEKGTAAPGKSAPWLFIDQDPSDYPEVVAYFEAREKEKDDAPAF